MSVFVTVPLSPSLPVLLSGWIVSLAALKTSVPVGVIMMLNAILFTAQAAIGVVMLKRVNLK
jgi:hypothetical protein